MAKLIPFEKLELGKEYQIQSRYWHKMLDGPFVITELSIETGMGRAKNVSPNRREFIVEADWDWFWDDLPSEDEQWKQVLNFKLYVPPRKLNGVYYSGRGLPDDWKQELDKLVVNLKNTFENRTAFKRDNRDPSKYFIWESKLKYPVFNLLVRTTGMPDYESIEYVSNSLGVDINSAERDSFGWITGAIDKFDIDSENTYRILFG